MTRPITLFTGQWADLPFTEVCRLAADWGFDGLEIACWGDHLDVERAAEDDTYVRGVRDTLERYGLGCWTISAHLVGQAVCDVPLDARHEAVLPARVWGDGRADGVHERAAAEMATTARAAARLGVDRVVGFTGSSIWYALAMFPPTPAAMVDAGYRDFADRWNPVLDVFDEVGVRFAHEVHPTEIAYDHWSTARALDAIGHRPAFGLNFDPSHFVWQDLDPLAFLSDFRDRIYHVHCKDSKRRLDGRNGRLGSHRRGVIPGVAGTSSPSGTATSSGSRSSGCSTRSATTGPRPSSARTPGWTASSGRRTRWRSSVAWRPSSRPEQRSTPPSPRGPETPTWSRSARLRGPAPGGPVQCSRPGLASTARLSGTSGRLVWRPPSWRAHPSPEPS